MPHCHLAPCSRLCNQGIGMEFELVTIYTNKVGYIVHQLMIRPMMDLWHRNSSLHHNHPLNKQIRRKLNKEIL